MRTCLEETHNNHFFFADSNFCPYFFFLEGREWVMGIYRGKRHTASVKENNTFMRDIYERYMFILRRHNGQVRLKMANLMHIATDTPRCLIEYWRLSREACINTNSFLLSTQEVYYCLHKTSCWTTQIGWRYRIPAKKLCTPRGAICWCRKRSA